MMADDGSTQYFGWGGEAFGGLETVADLGFEFGEGKLFPGKLCVLTNYLSMRAYLVQFHQV